MDALFEVHPRRARYLGEEGLLGLVRAAEQRSQHVMVATGVGTSVMAFLMFLWGHGVAEEPLLPWVEAALRQDPRVDAATAPDARAQRLEQGLFRYRDHLAVLIPS